MADSEHSSSDDSNMYSTEEESKLEFSEDEEILIIRMYNLIGERWSLIAGENPGQNSRGNREILELQIFHQRVKKPQYLIGVEHDIIAVNPWLRQKGREVTNLKYYRMVISTYASAT